MSDILNPIFTNENKARLFLEQQRWPDGAADVAKNVAKQPKARGKRDGHLFSFA